MNKPLAFRIRPKTLTDIIGQEDLVGENGFLTNSVKAETPISFILYGPPGTGKTTIAEAYANSLKAHTIKLNAVTSNKKDIEQAILEAKLYPTTIVIIDEIHRINKDKQDILLPYVENGTIFLIGATTANPYISINRAIRSRVHLLEVKTLTTSDIVNGLKRAISNKDGYDNKLVIDNASLEYIAKSSGGDFRFALNYLEILSISFKNQEITIDKTKTVLKVSNLIADKDEDGHYDSVSALQKSIRGQDVNAALYYAARLLISNDLESLTRRLLVTAYEDIGIANPQACMRTKIAIDSALTVGLPEAVIPISVAIVDLCLSPHSKTACLSMYKAMDAAKDMPLPVLDYLKYTPVNVAQEDKYPYDLPSAWPYLQYLPEALKDAKFYLINKNASSSYEKALNDNYLKICNIIRSSNIREVKKKHSK